MTARPQPWRLAPPEVCVRPASLPSSTQSLVIPAHFEDPQLLQPAANQIERLLAGPGANVLPVAAKASFHHIGLLAIGHADVNQAYRLLLRATAGTGDARDPEAKGRGCLASNPLCQSPATSRLTAPCASISAGETPAKRVLSWLL